MENKIAECLNLLALKTHTYNCDDCLKDIMEIITSQQKPEKQISAPEIEDILSENLKQNALVGCGHTDQVKLELYGIEECAKIIHSKIQKPEISWLSEEEIIDACGKNRDMFIGASWLQDKLKTRIQPSDLQKEVDSVDLLDWVAANDMYLFSILPDENERGRFLSFKTNKIISPAELLSMYIDSTKP